MQPNSEGVCAGARCPCGSQVFYIEIYTCGYGRAFCSSCDKVWAGSIRGPWFDASGDEAVGERADESSNVVSAEEARKVKRREQCRDSMRRLRARRLWALANPEHCDAI